MRLICTIFIFLFVVSINNISGQTNTQTTTVDIKRSDLFKPDMTTNINRFIGNVHMVHEDINLWCDSLYQYNDSNYIEAFGNVKMIQNDSIFLDGDYMFYDANIKFAKMRRNVVFRDPQMTLTTDFLDYDGIFEIGYYYNWGRIVDDVNTLDSRLGNYFSKTKIAYFKDSVTLLAPEYILYSDTLVYNTETKIASIVGPTNIHGRDSNNNRLYSEDGWYNTLIGHAEMYKNNIVHHKSYTGIADTMIIDSISNEAILIKNVWLKDSINDVIVEGHYARMDGNTNKGFVTDSALLILVGTQDSLFLHSDTLFMEQDSLENNILKAYYRTRFFSQDIQGLCDSMVYLSVDSTITLYTEPVVWASGNQITGEVLILLTGDGVVKEFYVRNNAMMIARRDETEMYDQIKGRNMTGYFRDNDLYMVYVDGSGETIYYPDDNGVIIGVNNATSSNIRIMITERRVTDIIFLNKPDGELNPLFLTDPSTERLKGFDWLIDLRPFDKYDIFNYRPPKNLVDKVRTTSPQTADETSEVDENLELIDNILEIEDAIIENSEELQDENDDTIEILEEEEEEEED